ncbi:hypothetical protein GQ42DRAFT_22607 [Ramicandelaber brevisporus]|nr:hypothetical protein GQ42DRAFT_22607 [Ramicandelaber brevisporus]
MPAYPSVKAIKGALFSASFAADAPASSLEQGVRILTIAICQSEDVHLDEDRLSALLKICSTSAAAALVQLAHECLMVELAQPHSLVRLKALRICRQMMDSFRAFRHAMAGDAAMLRSLVKFVIGTCEHDTSVANDAMMISRGEWKQLPGPVEHARDLHQLGYECVMEWAQVYGRCYPHLLLVARYIRERWTDPATVRAQQQQQQRQINNEQSAASRQASRIEQQRLQKESMLNPVRNRMFSWLVDQVRAELPAILTTMHQLDEAEPLLGDIYDFYRKLDTATSASRPKSIFTDDGREYQRLAKESGLHASSYEVTITLNPANIRHALASAASGTALTDSPAYSSDGMMMDVDVDVGECVVDLLRVVQRNYLPKVKRWTEVCRNAQPEDDCDTSSRDGLLEELIKLCDRMENRMDDYAEVGLTSSTRFKRADQSGFASDMDIAENNDYSDEDEFEMEEVELPIIPINPEDKSEGKGKGKGKDKGKPSSGLHAGILHPERSEHELQTDPTLLRSIHSKPRQKPQPSTGSVSAAIQPAAGPLTKEDKLRESAPVVPFDSDLLYWDSSRATVATSGFQPSHRFYGSADEPEMNSSLLHELRKRVMPYKDPLVAANATASPVRIKECRYPMSNGKLCRRRDLKICPYHGPVMPRDEKGNLTDPDQIREAEAKRAKLDQERWGEQGESLRIIEQLTKAAKDGTTSKDEEDDDLQISVSSTNAPIGQARLPPMILPSRQQQQQQQQQQQTQAKRSILTSGATDGKPVNSLERVLARLEAKGGRRRVEEMQAAEFEEKQRDLETF